MVGIGANISSQQATRALDKASAEKSKVYERLSSGLRINRAADDAAGLSVASSLNLNQRVFSQGVRNLNDGISFLSIASDTVDQLSQIVTRLSELATQGANGTFGFAQRKSLDREAQQLSDEFSRLVRAASFNGQKIFDGSASTLNLQGGFGSAGVLSTNVGGARASGSFRNVGGSSGTGVGNSARSVDLNGDGNLDVVSVGGGSIQIQLGKGDGTFQGATTLANTSGISSLAVGDVNGDGIIDIVGVNLNNQRVEVYSGARDGSFSLSNSYSATISGANDTAVELADLNKDGALDIIVSGTDAPSSAATLWTFQNSGNGRFTQTRSQTLWSSGYTDTAAALAIGDVNGDGNLDIVVGGNLGDSEYDHGVFSVFNGDGRGSITASGTMNFLSANYTASIALGDLNNDGKLDVVAGSNNGALDIILQAPGEDFSTVSAGYGGLYFSSVKLLDLNLDGKLDIVGSEAGGNVIAFRGTGSGGIDYAGRTTLSTTGGGESLVIGDFNNDGVSDIVAGYRNPGQFSTGSFLANTTSGLQGLESFSLQSVADSRQALARFQVAQQRLSSQRGIIGAYQSQINIDQNLLGVQSDNYAGSASRITSADVAQDSALLVQKQILEQAAAGVLSQANTQPALALRLLNG